SAAYQTISGTFLSYAELAVLLGVGIQVLTGALTIGGLFGFTGAYWRVVNSFRTLTTVMPTLARLAGQVSRVEEFEALAAPRARRTDHPAIELSAATFAFNGTPVLEAVDLTIRKGERVLIR